MTREDFEKIADNLICYAEDMHARTTAALIAAYDAGAKDMGSLVFRGDLTQQEKEERAGMLARKIAQMTNSQRVNDA